MPLVSLEPVKPRDATPDQIYYGIDFKAMECPYTALLVQWLVWAHGDTDEAVRQKIHDDGFVPVTPAFIRYIFVDDRLTLSEGTKLGK